MNYPTADTGHIYPEMSKYIDSNGFTFDHKEEITTEDWKKNNLKEIANRMSGWQLESFKESYEHKIKNGISLFKKYSIQEK